MPADMTRTPKITANVISRVNPDGSISIMRLDNDQYFYQIDGLHADFWKQINGKRTLSAIEKRITPKKLKDPERLRADVTKIAAGFKKEKLIELNQ